MKLFARAALFLWPVVASGAALTAAQLTTFRESSTTLVSVLLPPPDPCVSYQLQIGPPAPWPSEDITILGGSPRGSSKPVRPVNRFTGTMRPPARWR